MTKKCACCNRAAETEFCSLECACMSGAFSVRDGRRSINPDEPIKRCPPKKPWYLDDDDYLDYIAKFGWQYEGGKYVLREESNA